MRSPFIAKEINTTHLDSPIIASTYEVGIIERICQNNKGFKQIKNIQYQNNYFNQILDIQQDKVVSYLSNNCTHKTFATI